MEWSRWLVVSLAVACVCAESRNNVLVSLNSFKRVRLASDNFLALSVSPSQLLTADNISESTMSLLEGLAPAYLHIGGAESENITLDTLDDEPASTSHTFTESQWTRLNLLAADTGLSLVFTLSTNISPREFHTLLSCSDKQGFNPTYQYGHEMSAQHLNIQALRDRLVELRRTLDSFPRYQNTALLCPDIRVDDNPTYVQELQEFLTQTRDIAPVLIMRGKTKAVRNEKEIVETLREPTAFINKVLHEKVNKTQVIQSENNYQLWIADSEEVRKERSWADAVVWTLRLGHAARQGYQTILWHPTQLTKPTLEYWVSLLHRQVVGGAVLNARVVSGSSSGVSVFAHCSTYSDTQDSARGAVVVWGVSLAHQATSLTLLTTFTPRVLVYSLTLQDGEPFLNGQRLSLSHGALPRLSPEVRQLGSNMSVDVASHSIFFLVLPDLRARACLSPLTTGGDDQPNSLLWRTPKTDAKNYIVEKGGVFHSSEDDLVRSTKLNSHLKNVQKIIEDQETAGSLKVPNVKEDVEDWLKKLAIVNKSGILTQEEVQTLTELIIDERPPELEKTKVVFGTENKNERFKRSEAGETAQMLSTRLSLPISSPLFRKLYFLRKSRPLDTSNLLLSKGLGEINPTIETKTENPTPNHIVITSAKPSVLVDAGKQNNLDSKKQLMSKQQKSDESESIHYYPGEFYEMLGSLKIQSDIPLKDLAGSHEAIDSILSEELKCKNCESKMQVVKKDQNNNREDEKVIQNASESLRDYFNKVNQMNPSLNINAGKISSEVVEQKYQGEALPEIISSENVEKKGIEQLKNNIPQKPSFSKSETSNDLTTQKRIKRDTDSFKYISQIFQNDNQEEASNSSTINSSEEKELRQFLEELTIEGEELLEDFNENIERKNTYLKYNSETTKPEEFKDKAIEKKDGNNEDYFLRNNLVVEEKPKSRRTYSPRLLLVSQNSLGTKKTDNDWKTIEKEEPMRTKEGKAEVLITAETPLVSQAVSFIRTTEKIPEEFTVQGDKGITDFNLGATSTNNDQPIKTNMKHTPDPVESSKDELVDDKTKVVELKPYPRVAEPLTIQDIPDSKTEVIKLNKYPKVLDNLVPKRRLSRVENNLKEKVPKPIDTQLLRKSLEDSVPSFDQVPTRNLPDVHDKTFKSKISRYPKFDRNILHRYFNPLAAAPTTHLSFQNKPASPDKDKQFVGSSEVEVETPPLLKLILDNRRKNRINSIKQRLAKARERMVTLPKPRNIPAVKPNKKEETLKKTTIPVEIESSVEIPNTAEKKIFGRRKRQVSENLEKGKLEIEEISTSTAVHPISENKTSEVASITEMPSLSTTPVTDHITDDHHLTEELPIDDVLIESSQIPLHKWIIPLSNHTEKIILKNQIFPVKLYGILSDEWAKEKNKSKSNDIVESPPKEKRSIRYSCIKDRFFDDEAEEETQAVSVKEASKKQEEQMSQSEIIEVKEPKDKKFTEITPILILSPENSHRVKRSTSENTQMTENKLKGLLTNEIVKESPRDNDSKSQEQEESNAEEEEESDFNFMLRKSVKELAGHKSGMERMLELAKEYKKTNPDSLETFDIHNKVNPEKSKHVHKHKKEEPETEKHSENTDETKNSKKDRNFSLSETNDGGAKQSDKNNQTSFDQSDFSSQENFFSSFVNKTKVYFNNMNLFPKSSDNKDKTISEHDEVAEHTNYPSSKPSNSSSENILTSIFNKSKDFIQNITTYIEKHWDPESAEVEDD